MTQNSRNDSLVETAQQYLHFLSVELPSRRMGSEGNRAATDFCARVLRSNGFETTTPGFSCLDWVTQGAVLQVMGKDFPVHSSPYANGCIVNAPLRTAASLSELQSVSCKDEILLLHGDLAQEQLMPKNFTFYNPEPHQRIIALLEEKSPAAIIAATSRNPELTGAIYPFPLIEDGDFNISSVYTTEKTGRQLALLAGQTVHLISQAERIPARGCNVLGRLHPGQTKKIVICAHIDAKMGTSGALDNASGVVTLLLLSHLLKEHTGDCGIELLVMNGEDYYGANGEKLYLEQNGSTLGDIRLFINMDGLGYIKGKTAFSFYNQLENTLSLLRETLSLHPGTIEGETWYQSDHAIMVMNGVPAVAVTCEYFAEICRKFTHTPRDIPALVDARRLVEAALTVREMVDAQSILQD